MKLASKIDSFQDRHVYEQNWLISRPSEMYMVENSIKLTYFRTITRLFIIFCEIDFFQDHSKEENYNSAQYRTVKVIFGLISGPSMRNLEDTGHRGQGQFIFHCHLHHSGNTLFHKDILVPLIFILRPS